MRRTLLLALVALTLPAAAAPAAVVSVTDVPDDPAAGSVDVRGLGGERNDLLVVQRGDVLTVRERGRARLIARTGCRSLGRRAARCDLRDAGAGSLVVDGGRGDDRVHLRVPGHPYTVAAALGGPGNDALRGDGGVTLAGGPGRDVLRGGTLGDDLTGGPGRDRLAGAGGADVLTGDATALDVRSDQVRRAPASPDVLDGGPGRDTVRYDERRRGVRVDLARGRGAEDRLRSIESVSGSHGDDVLLGTRGRNVLLGGEGRDVLVGRAGADRLDAGGNDHVVTGGRDPAVDVLACGAGPDVVAGVGREILPRSCERLGLEYESVEPYVQLLPAGSGRVRLQVVCSLESLDCERTVTVRHGGRVLGRSRPVRVRTEIAWVTVRLDKALPARGVLRVDVTGSDRLTFEDPPVDDPYRLTYRLRR
jgi:Ca2+-binding RTX toxin-like protein